MLIFTDYVYDLRYFIKQLALCIYCKEDGVESLKTMPDYNLGQKIIDKFTKLSKIIFPWE